ncbi:hypothetical protein N7G274_010469 [Stereocaulon virgatum]|uniref:Uncharacterized protein n=1 Tax=Stereocaulon virgatum TaxID=373712 RepID=A0ABR3ZVQ0_9LECA
MYTILITRLLPYLPALLAMFSVVSGAGEGFACSAPSSEARLSNSACQRTARVFFQQHRRRHYILRHKYAPGIPSITCPLVIRELDCVLTLDYKVTRSPGINPFVDPEYISDKALELARRCVDHENVDGGYYTENPSGFIEIRVALAHSPKPFTNFDSSLQVSKNINSTNQAIAPGQMRGI